MQKTGKLNVQRAAAKKERSEAKKPTSAPLAVGQQRGGSGRADARSSKTGITFSRREFIGSVTTGTTGYSLCGASATTPGYDLNPACHVLFPWLAHIAVGFERYRFSRITVELVPSAPATVAGRIYAAVDYDYDDPVATDKASLMGNLNAVEGPVWQGLTLKLDATALHRDQGWKYISAWNSANFVEPRTAYCGFLMIAGDTTTACVFDIWVDYEVTLDIPVHDFASIQNGLGAPNVNVVPAVGTTWSQLDCVPMAPAPGPLRVVRPGSEGVPILPTGVVSMEPYVPTWAFDLAGTRGMGNITQQVKVQSAGISPNDMLGKRMTLSALVYDSVGKYLGAWTGENNGQTLGVGPMPGDDPTIAGSFAKIVSSIRVEDIQKLYNTARFVSTVIQVVNGLGWASATVNSGYKFAA